MSTLGSLSAILLTKEKSVHVLFKDPLPLGRRPTTAILIRARSVVRGSTASARRPCSYRAGSRQDRRLRWLLVSFNLALEAAERFHKRSERRPELYTRPYDAIKNRANFGFSAPSVLPRPHAQGPVTSLRKGCAQQLLACTTPRVT